VARVSRFLAPGLGPLSSFDIEKRSNVLRTSYPNLSRQSSQMNEILADRTREKAHIISRAKVPPDSNMKQFYL
jgi:hypothetical protein